MSNPNKAKAKMGLDRTDELMREVFMELRSMGGSGSPKAILAAVKNRVTLSPVELESTEWFLSRGLTGARWETVIRFWTSTCTKAGFLTKAGGVWTLTEAGEKALKLPKGRLIREAKLIAESAKQGTTAADGPEAEIEAPDEVDPEKAIYDKAVEDARSGIDVRLDALGPYDFQNMIAELLRAMGYYVRDVSPPGADGGIDILAFRDPLGLQTPHLKVQVKHRGSTKLNPKEVRELIGVMNKDTDIGLLVSSGGFTREAERAIKESAKHLDGIDRERLLVLWQENYHKLSERGKQYLPLVAVYFVTPSEP